MTSTRPMIVLVAAAALAACDSSPPPATTAATAIPPPVPAAPAPSAARPLHPEHRLEAALPNGEFLIDIAAGGRLRLDAGVYEEAGPGASGGVTVRLGPAPVYGDLDGDGVEDAAVILQANPGGSGVFTYLAAVLDRGDRTEPVAAKMIGDRIVVDAVRIADGRVQLDWRDRAPGVPMASPPTVQTRSSFIVRGGMLVADEVDAVAGDPAVENLRGRYTWGAEVETLQPCGSASTFWLAGDATLLQPLRDRAIARSQASGKPYEPIYVEVSAVSEGKASDGFARDYDAVYRLRDVRQLEDVVPAECAAAVRE